MDQNEFKKAFVASYKEFLEYCKKRTKEVAKDDRDHRPGVAINFDSFMEWLETGEVA